MSYNIVAGILKNYFIYHLIHGDWLIQQITTLKWQHAANKSVKEAEIDKRIL